MGRVGKKRKSGVKRQASSGGKKSPAASRTFGVKRKQITPITLESMKTVVVGVPDSAGKGFRTLKKKPRTFGVKVSFTRGIDGVTGGMETCPEGCPGEYIEGMWIHSKECRWSAILWRAHGKTEKDWSCPYNCPPQEISSGWTHQWECAFWDRTGRTPFDHNSPHGTAKVETARGGSGKQVGDVRGGIIGGHGKVVAEKYRAQQKVEGKLWQENVPILFDDEADDDLPF